MPKRNPKIPELELEVLSLRIELETERSKATFKARQIEAMAQVFLSNCNAAKAFDDPVETAKLLTWKAAFTLLNEISGVSPPVLYKTSTEMEGALIDNKN